LIQSLNKYDLVQISLDVNNFFGTVQGHLYNPDFFFMSPHNFQEMALESAITLLEKQVELQPTCKLHQMLGDLLARVHEEEKALDHYSIALK